MSHTIAFTGGSTIPIYVDPEGWQESARPIVVEHNILDTTHSTYQFMGAKSTTLSLKFAMYGQGAFEYLLGKIRDGYQFVYTDDRGTSGSFMCPDQQVSWSRMQALNYADAWYRAEMKMANLTGSGSLFYQWTAP
jgi:hypothetical protein